MPKSASQPRYRGRGRARATYSAAPTPMRFLHILTPLATTLNVTGTQVFPSIDTLLGRMALIVRPQAVQTAKNNVILNQLVATLTLHRQPETSRHNNGPPNLPRVNAPHQPMQCTLTLAVTSRAHPGTMCIPAPQAIALDKHAQAAAYLATFTLPTMLDRDTYVYEARIRIEPMSATDSPSAFPDLYLATLDVPAMSDCALKVGDEEKGMVYVSKAMLAGRSNYFRAMFGGPRAESGNLTADGKPIVTVDKCHMSAVIPCLIHMYSGWLPGTRLPTHIESLGKLMAKHKWTIGRMTRRDWSAVVELAEFWQMPAAMCWAAKRVVGRHLEWECDLHLADMMRGESMGVVEERAVVLRAR